MTKEVLPLANNSFATRDSILGTTVVAGHTVSAVAVPGGATVIHGDIMKGAGALAEAAGDAGVGGMELAVGDDKRIE